MSIDSSKGVKRRLEKASHPPTGGVLSRTSSKDAGLCGENAGQLFDIDRDTLLSAGQLADKLQVSIKTVRHWRYTRILPPDVMVKVGRHLVRYRWLKVLEWLGQKGSSDEHSQD